MDTFDALFRTAESSDFLKGKNNNGWKADFDWMMNAGNFAKILEGRYNNREVPKEHKGSFDTDEFVDAAVKASYATMEQTQDDPQESAPVEELPEPVVMPSGKRDYSGLWSKIM